VKIYIKVSHILSFREEKEKWKLLTMEMSPSLAVLQRAASLSSAVAGHRRWGHDASSDCYRRQL
jgi:hypothetical protein